MTFPFFSYNLNSENPAEPPFSIVIAHREMSREGTWRPSAFVALTKGLRTSGFLGALPPEDLKTFLLFLSFITAEGHCAVTVALMASALRLSSAKTRSRLERLRDWRWMEQPIILSYHAGSGQEIFSFTPGFLPVVEEEPMPHAPTSIKAAPREVVIEYSRSRYGRPRAAVERQIAELNNWDVPQEGDEAPESPQPQKSEPVDSQRLVARRNLLRAGLLPEQADELLARFDLVRIQRQLMWLPQRVVRNRAGFLLAAIKDDYAAPAHFRHFAAKPEEADEAKEIKTERTNREEDQAIAELKRSS